ncbi:MAG: SH3 domain-containing protein [Chloroflexi bacterium]|nr:SH3 domain-containing protein [Chloroflexota bacterium]
MKARIITSILVILFFCSAASAQSYAIRLTYNTNLRTANSLTSGVVDTAPAGSILQVLGQQGRWLQINWNGNQVWMAGWVGHSRVQSPQQTTSPPQNQPQSQIDNCCFVDRQCNSVQEWTDGYWAFQRGECRAPAQTQTQPQPQTQPQTSIPTQRDIPDDLDNCCNLDRECHSEEDWAAGWSAFRNHECMYELSQYLKIPVPGAQPASGSNNCCTAPGWICQNDEHFDAGYRAYLNFKHCSPQVRSWYMPYYRHIYTTDNCCDLGRECHTEADWQRGYTDFRFFRCSIDIPVVSNLPVHLQGSQDFIDYWKASFSLLKAQSPRFYDYAITGINSIIETHLPDAHCTARCDLDNTIYCELQERYDHIDHKSIAVTASVLVHEACHCHRDMKGYPHGDTYYERELPCNKAQSDLMKELDPGNSFGVGWDYERKAREHGVTDLRY